MHQLENIFVYVKKIMGELSSAQLIVYIADAYVKLGNNSKARTLLEKALMIQENHYGTRKHIVIANTLSTVGQVYMQLGDVNKAMDILEEALTIQGEYYGTDKNIEVTFTMSRLGKAYIQLGDYNKARVLLEKSLVFQESYYGPNNPEFADILIALAKL